MLKIEHKIIALLSNYPEKEFYGQEIAQKINCNKGSASTIARMLTEKKIVIKRTAGHMKFYRINQKSIEVKKFKIDHALEKLEPIVLKLKNEAKKIVLFGSVSRGEQTFNSDIDLFILTSSKEEVRKELKKINSKLRIKAVIKSQSEWSEMEVGDKEFYYEVKNGIILYEYVPRI